MFGLDDRLIPAHQPELHKRNRNQFLVCFMFITYLASIFIFHTTKKFVDMDYKFTQIYITKHRISNISYYIEI
ncbi:hypothetical protein HanRHA438_Chr13g0589201 [Helianthus annuus]|nr:hypothetical protein HanIR_Chr13g0629561 [Helianthus annuus]KAJ0857361.1 hypothetical protein HanRHA438_Chr13g0589201 [Helianthus annuus]